MNTQAGKPQILFAEDNEMMQALLENFFADRYQVIAKANGLDALKWLEEGNIPSLIISDIEMPDLDGFEFIKIIRSSSFYYQVPMFVLSGRQKSEDRLLAYRLGANDFITKPFHPEELALKIAQCLRQSLPGGIKAA